MASVELGENASEEELLLWRVNRALKVHKERPTDGGPKRCGGVGGYGHEDEPRYRFLLSGVVERWRGEEILLEDEGML